MNGKILLGWRDWDTTWETYAKWQRSFTLKNGNNVCYNRCQELSVESFMIPTCSKSHGSTEAPRVAEGAVGHGSMQSRGSLIPYFPAVLLSVGSQAFSPCWKMQCWLVIGAVDTPLLPTPSSPAQTLPFSRTQEVWDQHVLCMSLQYPQLSQEKEKPDPDPVIHFPGACVAKPWGSPIPGPRGRVRGAEIPVQLCGEQDTALWSQELWQHPHLIPWEHMAWHSHRIRFHCNHGDLN